MLTYTFLVLVLGSCIGSFLNVVIYRLPKRKSFIFNRSQCPSCHRCLNYYDLFPFFSWIFLGGKCRYCSNSINIRYPLVELITSLLFFLCLHSKGFVISSSPGLFFIISGWLLVSYLLILFFIDIDEYILPDSLTYSGSFIGLFLVFVLVFFIEDIPNTIFLDHLLAFCLGFFGISIFSLIVKLIIHKPALGGGDAKLFAMSGAWLGLEGLEVSITLSFLFAALFVFFGFIFNKLKRGEYIPFGPFICFSIFLVWFLGPQFWFESLGDIFWWKYL